MERKPKAGNHHPRRIVIRGELLTAASPTKQVALKLSLEGAELSGWEEMGFQTVFNMDETFHRWWIICLGVRVTQREGQAEMRLERVGSQACMRGCEHKSVQEQILEHQLVTSTETQSGGSW